MLSFCCCWIIADDVDGTLPLLRLTTRFCFDDDFLYLKFVEKQMRNISKHILHHDPVHCIFLLVLT